ncbi:LysR family transcriptional regulator [Pandoraea terrae]|uniref:LysR family transcriptional regulator n=1 Tax=Pandoraea terrae TaxID=1537710 RepID=A0A5E4VDZ8_9BURK|nr:LysR substrate-binding domain-containing protein [Pandoraea terrae]VVE09629.1 LysR family transcriptional regulator [Pandoraea terrae]
MRYDLTDLRLFVAIAVSGSISGGAEDCHLAPSSASLRLKTLEQDLGTKLFDREVRGVKLTPAGVVMLEHARRCLADLEQMHAHLAPYAEGVVGHVTLFANSSAIASFLSDDLERFLMDNPKVRVVLEEKLSHDIIAAVADGRADIGVVTWENVHPGLTFHDYREDELVVLSKRRRQDSLPPTLSFLDCLKFPFISLQSGAAIHTFLAGKASSVGHRMDVRIQVGSFASIVALVRSGAGIAIVPRSVLRPMECDGVAVSQLKEEWANRRLRLCVPRHREISAYAVSMLDNLLRAGSASKA